MRSPFVVRLILPALFAIGLSAFPLEAAVNNRIATVNDNSRRTIEHTIPARARLATDLGEAPADRRLDSVTLHFNMTDAQQAELNQLLIDQQNPSSPHYHQWLSPEQFAARFGLSSSDLAKISSWLTGKGLTITSVGRTGTMITFSGTVGQIEQALGTRIHAYSLNGEQHIANVADPSLPAAISDVVMGVTGLHDFKLKPRAHVRPNYTSSITGNHYIAPGDFYTIYDINPNSINGAGVSIAVVGQTDISTSDVDAFRAASGLSSNSPTIVKATGYVAGTVASDIDEAQLDVEWSGAVAPNASISFVTVGASQSASVIDALLYAISNKVAPIISISYGSCEASWGQSTLASINKSLQMANTMGITVVGPGGDSGATDCDSALSTATQGLAVDFPASSPFVTGIGGTMFNEGTGTYWNSSNGSYSGSATGYIPETVWNESNSSGLGAGGGGASAYFSKPAWQVGTGVPSDLSRDVPDISLDSAASHDGYLFCSKGSCTNGFRNSSSNLNVVGGTSVATPAFAGILALLEQKLNATTGLGNVNPQIYGLANSTYYNNAFHDINSGNNDSPCTAGTPDCPNGGSIGYNATTGYDLATGWGSLDVANFVNKWSLASPTGVNGSIGTAISTTTVSTTSASCGLQGKIALTITVAGSGSTPTGTVQIVDLGPSGTASTVLGSATLSGGTATYTLDTSTLSSGGNTINAVYSGDSNYAGSKGPLSLDIVSSSQKDFALTPCTASASARSGSTANGVTFTLTPANGFTGTITLSASADSPLSGTYTFTPSSVTIGSTSAVTTSFVLTAFVSQARTGSTLSSSNGPPLRGRAPWYVAGSGATLACALLLIAPRRRRWGALLAVLLSVAAISVSGCGSSSSSSTGSGSGGGTVTNATPGTYTVNVTATSGNLVHTSTVTFTVQ
ncbi:protease pro-enzyme activation domain-containing protein [Edaphobacter bradus]|uniref:protease pro-enzyme activation domain-containing protein n=1 Tax=Edaphobacter bradus TaxID=2259016 RepID=UPI0021E06BEB|nr:protease pro-enzyme activation domain-containing protein [Edaphobacter bradus]